MGRIVGFFNFDYLDKVGAALFNMEGQLLKFNKSFKKWTGCKKSSSVLELFPEMSGDRFEKGITKRGRFSYKTTIQNKRGDEIDLTLAFRKITRRGEDYIFAQVDDRTREREKDAILQRATQLLEKRNRELDRVNRDLTEAYDQLLLTGKLMAVGEMAASMILEMRHPVQMMMANAQLLDDFIRDPEATEMLQDIIQYCTQVSKILEGLHSYAEKKERDLDPHSVKALLDDAFKLCRRPIESQRIRLTTPLVDENLKIACRPTEISQVFINLLNNAAEAVGGTDGAWIRVEVEQKDSNLEIAVVDSGEGLPESLAQKIMEPFFTTKDAGAGSGTGLGLTISKKIMTSHRGKLTLDTDSPNTRFVMTLPLVEDSDSAE